MSDFYNTWQILGQAVGIEPKYTDNWGRIHYTDPRTAIRESLKPRAFSSVRNGRTQSASPCGVR